MSIKEYIESSNNESKNKIIYLTGKAGVGLTSFAVQYIYSKFKNEDKDTLPDFIFYDIEGGMTSKFMSSLTKDKDFYKLVRYKKYDITLDIIEHNIMSLIKHQSVTNSKNPVYILIDSITVLMESNERYKEFVKSIKTEMVKYNSNITIIIIGHISERFEIEIEKNYYYDPCSYINMCADYHIVFNFLNRKDNLLKIAARFNKSREHDLSTVYELYRSDKGFITIKGILD